MPNNGFEHPLTAIAHAVLNKKLVKMKAFSYGNCLVWVNWTTQKRKLSFQSC